MAYISVYYSPWIDRNLRFGILRRRRRRRRRLTRNSRTIQAASKEAVTLSVYSLLSLGRSVGRSVHVIIISPAVSIHHRHKGTNEGTKGGPEGGRRANEKPIRSAAAHFAASKTLPPSPRREWLTHRSFTIVARNTPRRKLLSMKLSLP